MNRTLALGWIVAGLSWLILYGYDSGNDHRVDYAVIVATLAVGIIAVAHLFADRGITIWNSGVTGILIREVGWLALFLWFGLRFNNPRLDPGISQGLLDVVRVAAPIGGAMLIGHLARNRIDRRHTGDVIRAGSLLVPEPTWPEVERRNNPYGRRDTDQPDYKEPTL